VEEDLEAVRLGQSMEYRQRSVTALVRREAQAEQGGSPALVTALVHREARAEQGVSPALVTALVRP